MDDTFPSVICTLSLLQLSSSVKAVPVSLIWSMSVRQKRVSKAVTHATCSWRSLWVKGPLARRMLGFRSSRGHGRRLRLRSGSGRCEGRNRRSQSEEVESSRKMLMLRPRSAMEFPMSQGGQM